MINVYETKMFTDVLTVVSLILLTTSHTRVNGYEIYHAYIGNDLHFSFDCTQSFLHLFRAGDDPMNYWFFSNYELDGNTARIEINEAIPSDTGNYTYYGDGNYEFAFGLNITTGHCENKKIPYDSTLRKITCTTSNGLKYRWMMGNKTIENKNVDYSIRETTISHDALKSDDIHEIIIKIINFDTEKIIRMETKYFGRYYTTNSLVL